MEMPNAVYPDEGRAIPGISRPAGAQTRPPRYAKSNPTPKTPPAAS